MRSTSGIAQGHILSCNSWQPIQTLPCLTRGPRSPGAPTVPGSPLTPLIPGTPGIPVGPCGPEMPFTPGLITPPSQAQSPASPGKYSQHPRVSYIQIKTLLWFQELQKQYWDQTILTWYDVVPTLLRQRECQARGSFVHVNFCTTPTIKLPRAAWTSALSGTSCLFPWPLAKGFSSPKQMILRRILGQKSCGSSGTIVCQGKQICTPTHRRSQWPSAGYL